MPKRPIRDKKHFMQRMNMKKFTKITAVAAVVLALTTAGVSNAQAGGWPVAAGVVGGLAVGTAVGATVATTYAAPPAYYPYAPAAYPAPYYAPYYAPAPVYYPYAPAVYPYYYPAVRFGVHGGYPRYYHRR
jgi:hypothetical protein